jgi:hypothetical protein
MQLRIQFCSLLFLVLLLASPGAKAQSFENAGDYMSYINKANEDLTATYLSYLSAVAHNRAKKVEKRRLDVVNAISQTRYTIQAMPPWKGDKSYRDTTLVYIKIVNSVFNEDYSKIVNMEEIAEQSYDAMEAYMLAQEKAGEKLKEAADRQSEMGKKFAAKYNITLVNSQNEIDRKGKEADALMKHYTDVYLIFFKPYKQEAYLIEASNKKNLIAIEENKNALQKFSEEGLEKLKDLRGYNNDPTLILACRQALNFYKKEAEQTQITTDFLLKEENFSKLKKAFDTKPAAKRTKEDIDAFNKAVNDYNDAVNSYNKSNKQINKDREKATNDWNDAVRKYLDLYMPVQRKVS